MQWLRDAGWLVAIVIVVVVLVMRPKPATQSDVNETMALIEKHKAESAERQATHRREIAKIATNGTLSMLRLVGKAYREHLAEEKKPPAEADFAGLKDVWTSNRDDKPFAFAFGADLTKLPDGGIGHVLAWEQTADAEGNRCVLLADGKTAKAMPDAEFQKLPKAK